MANQQSKGGAGRASRDGPPRVTALPPLFPADTRSDDDPDYVAYRDHGTKARTRARLEAAWPSASPFLPEAPEQFVREFRQKFHQRSFELYMVASLLDARVALERPPKKAPDVCVRSTTASRLWIECVVPEPGQGDDAPFQRPPGPWCGPLYPEEQLILRYMNALQKKLAAIDEYRRAKIIGPRDRVLVAVGQGAILDSDLHDNDLPLMVKAVLGIGKTVMRVGLYGAPSRVERVPRVEVRKRNGAAVATTLFLDDTGAALSGLLFVRQHVGNLSWKATEDFGLLHNPKATSPLRRGGLPVCCEMWVDDEDTLVHRGRCAEVGVYAEPRGRRAKAAAKARAEAQLDPDTAAFVEGHMRGRCFAEAEAEYDAREALRATPLVKLAERLANNFAHFARELADPNLDDDHRELYASWVRNIACSDWNEEPTKTAQLAHLFRAIRGGLIAIGARRAPPPYLHLRRVRLGIVPLPPDQKRNDGATEAASELRPRSAEPSIPVKVTDQIVEGVRIAPHWRALVLCRGMSLARDWEDRAAAWRAKEYAHAADVVVRDLSSLFPEDAPKISRSDLARALEEWNVFEASDRPAQQRGGRRRGRVGKFNALAEALKETSLASTRDALATAHTNWKNGRPSRAKKA